MYMVRSRNIRYVTLVMRTTVRQISDNYRQFSRNRKILDSDKSISSYLHCPSANHFHVKYYFERLEFITVVRGDFLYVQEGIPKHGTSLVKRDKKRLVKKFVGSTGRNAGKGGKPVLNGTPVWSPWCTRIRNEIVLAGETSCHSFRIDPKSF